MTESGFQRARRPEQVHARRAAILDAALSMLLERPVAEISLRELSDKVGLAKSNVLRYFDSREAIFLEVLDRTQTAWLDSLAVELPAAVKRGRGRGPYAREIRVASAIAASLIEQRLLCELFSSMAGVLERNISVDFARSFKSRASASSLRLAKIVRAELPNLSEDAAAHFAAAVFVLVAGMWPFANPTEAVATVIAEFGVPDAWEMFAAGLTEGLINQLIGLTARAAG